MKEYIKNLSKLKQKRLSISIGTLTIILIAIVITNMVGLGGFIAEAAKPITDVFVTNAGTNPVPVNGNVNVTNTPTVNIGNGSNVGITGTPNVNVANTVTNPVLVRDVDNPARLEPFRKGFLVMMKGNTGQSDEYIVPDGKMLVIEYVNGIVKLPKGRKLTDLWIRTSDPETEIHLPTEFQAIRGELTPEETNIFMVSEQIKYYATEKFRISIIASSDYVSDGGNVIISIIGYLVDVK